MKRFEPLIGLQFLFLTLICQLSNGYAVERQDQDRKQRKMFVVVIPRNTILFDIKDKKDLKTHKKIHAKAFTSSPGNSFLTIVDRSNRPRFLVNSKNIFSIDETAILKGSPKFFKPTFKKIKKDSFDKSISLNHDFFFEKNFLTLSLYNSKNNSLLKISKNYSSVIYDLTLKSKLPFFFGINTSLSKEGNQEDFMVSKIDVGLTLKTKAFSYLFLEKVQLALYGIQTLFQTMSIQGEKAELSTSALRIKVSKEISLMTKYRFKIGVGGSHNLSFFKKRNDSLFFDEKSYFSYGIFIGIQNKSTL